LDGSVRPGNAGWIVDGQNGQVIALGGGNSGIRQIDGDNTGYDEYYLETNDTSNTLATRFRVDAFAHNPSGDPRIQILALTPGGGTSGPAVGLSIYNKNGQDRWILDRFIGGHVEIVDVAPVVLGEWNVALIHIDTFLDEARFQWNYQELFNGTLPADHDGSIGYPEFGASNYWAQGGTSTVVFDWVGYGPGYIEVAVPEPSTCTLAVCGLPIAMLLYRRSRRFFG
jgi:hypothetical protein